MRKLTQVLQMEIPLTMVLNCIWMMKVLELWSVENAFDFDAENEEQLDAQGFDVDKNDENFNVKTHFKKLSNDEIGIMDGGEDNAVIDEDLFINAIKVTVTLKPLLGGEMSTLSKNIIYGDSIWIFFGYSNYTLRSTN